MKTRLLTIILVLFSPIVRAELIYDVTFENPPHVVGQEPATGSGIDRPLSPASGWKIRDDITGFSSQVAVLPESVNPGGLLNFGPGNVFDSGMHSIMWEASVLTLDLGDPLQIATSIGGPGGVTEDIGVDFLNTGIIRVTDVSNAGGGGISIGTWMPGDIFQFEALMNLDADIYDFFLNGTQVIDGQPLEVGASFTGVSYQRPFATSGFALDNFHWEIVPEPSSFVLLLCGGTLLMAWRRKRQRA